jgi:hypothetical protein
MIQKGKEKIRRGIFRIAIGSGDGGAGSVLLTKHAIRATGGRKEGKQNKTRKKIPSPEVTPLYVFLVKFLSSLFIFIFFCPQPDFFRFLHLIWSVGIKIQLPPMNQ